MKKIRYIGIFFLIGFLSLKSQKACLYSLNYKLDSITFGFVKIKKIYKVKCKYRKKIYKYQILDCEGSANLEVFDFLRKKIVTKGQYIKNEIMSTNEGINIEDDGTIMKDFSYFNKPCRDGEWLYFDKNKQVYKKEFWKCDSLIKVEKY
jgi:hypothetical protein